MTYRPSSINRHNRPNLFDFPWMEAIPIPDAEAKTFCRKNRFYFWCPFTNSLWPRVKFLIKSI
jgi:hypothetical protein